MILCRQDANKFVIVCYTTWRMKYRLNVEKVNHSLFILAVSKLSFINGHFFVTQELILVLHLYIKIICPFLHPIVGTNSKHYNNCFEASQTLDVSP